MSNWKLKRTGHHGLPPSTQRPADAITIVAATKTGSTSRKKSPGKDLSQRYCA
jgi:hypothetical protein